MTDERWAGDCGGCAPLVILLILALVLAVLVPYLNL